MSSTRRVAPGAPRKQSGFSSSPEFERGLASHLVARRCSVVESAEELETVYFLQLLSHRDGGLGRVANDLVETFPKQVKKHSGNIYRIPNQPAEEQFTSQDNFEELLARAAKADGIEYSPPPLIDKSRVVALSELSGFLEHLCLDPAHGVKASPWYFDGLWEALCEYRALWAERRRGETVVTKLGSAVYETLDYALGTKSMVVIEGDPRTGKTFAAQAWCEERPGLARYAQVPSTNDDVGFFRAIAKALGAPSGLSWKASELRERVEATLQGGDLILILDEAHYLWPVTGYRYGLPGRINWVMTALANHRVPVALVTTPQFAATQKVVERNTHWTSEQFIGRIAEYKKLPTPTDQASATQWESDLFKVARHVLPEGSEKEIEMLVCYAQGSAKYLAGIEFAVRRARYLARMDGRDVVQTGDVARAIRDGIPSDSAIAEGLQGARKPSRKPALSNDFTGRPAAAVTVSDCERGQIVAPARM